MGIVAGRLRERFNRPAGVVGVSEGVGKGSARSVPGLDLGSAVIAARHWGERRARLRAKQRSTSGLSGSAPAQSLK